MKIENWTLKIKNQSKRTECENLDSNHKLRVGKSIFKIQVKRTINFVVLVLFLRWSGKNREKRADNQFYIGKKNCVLEVKINETSQLRAQSEKKKKKKKNITRLKCNSTTIGPLNFFFWGFFSSFFFFYRNVEFYDLYAAEGIRKRGFCGIFIQENSLLFDTAAQTNRWVWKKVSNIYDRRGILDEACSRTVCISLSLCVRECV